MSGIKSFAKIKFLKSYLESDLTVFGFCFLFKFSPVHDSYTTVCWLCFNVPEIVLFYCIIGIGLVKPLKSFMAS